MTQNTKDAVPTQTLAEQAETLQRVYDLVGMGALARTPSILLTNLENMKRRSDCLSGIEQLFTYEVPDDDMPDEMTDECDLNWGQGRAEYVETFKAALPAFIARHPEYAPTAEQAEGVRVPQHWNPVYNTDPVQRACGELPEGWEIEILLENGAGCVYLIDPKGERTDFDNADKFDWTIHDAIEAALAAPAASTGDQEVGS